jgi:hypothetical protein
MLGVHPDPHPDYFDRYDFHEQIMRLDRVIDWLNGIGISSPDRLWQYRKNIRGMIDAAARGEMEQLIPTSKFSPFFWLTEQRHLRAKTGETAETSSLRPIAVSAADLPRPVRWRRVKR